MHTEKESDSLKECCNASSWQTRKSSQRSDSEMSSVLPHNSTDTKTQLEQRSGKHGQTFRIRYLDFLGAVVPCLI